MLTAPQGIGGGQSGQGFETFSADGKGESRETTAFGIGASDALVTQFGFENTDFFLLVGNDLLLVAVDPAGDHGDEDS